MFGADSTAGGLARTTEYKGYLFDVGGHRFYTRNSRVYHRRNSFVTRSSL